MAFFSADSKRLLRRVDFALLLAAAAIVVYGLVIISSATHINTPGDERFWFVQRQGIFAVINAVFAIFCMNFDYR
ncbi:MAG: rod shape-determining protein RodA, partial [Selenomonadaceae bacterium]|nr:rod shape-determining protein RodA [Selenomonadaceae bacterium]